MKKGENEGDWDETTNCRQSNFDGKDVELQLGLPLEWS
jgi:hypothetical protein